MNTAIPLLLAISGLAHSQADNATTATTATTTPEPLSVSCHIQDLVYLIDTSGSMGNDSSKRIWSPLALELLAQLQAVDIKKYTMLTYVKNVTTTLQTEFNDEMSDKIADLANGIFAGKTELTFLGLKTALEVAKKNNFIILFSDGVGNGVDNATAKQEIIDMVNDSQSKIFFLMTTSDEHPLEVMEENFNGIGTVIDIKSHEQQKTIDMIIDELRASEICGIEL